MKTGLQQQDHRGDIIGVSFTPYMIINTCVHKGGPIQPDILFFNLSAHDVLGHTYADSGPCVNYFYG